MHPANLRIALAGTLLCSGIVGFASSASAQKSCDIPADARDIWHCENGFVIGPENVIIRLPIPETDPEALYRAGLEAANRKDWRIAIAYFTAAHQQAHLVPKYMYNLGLAHARAGHEVAAVAWLSAYLVAEPNAANRTAIWEQIRQLEESIGGKISKLQAQAHNAAAAFPQEAPRARDEWAVPGLFIDTRDKATRHLEKEGRGNLYEALSRQGIRRFPLAFLRSFVEAGPLKSTTYEGRGYYLLSYAQRSSVEDANALAANGRLEQAIAQLYFSGDAHSPTLCSDLGGEKRRADVADILLAKGDITGAARVSGMMNDSYRRCGPPAGFETFRIAMLLLAEQGRPIEAAEGLQIFWTKRISAPWPGNDLDLEYFDHAWSAIRTPDLDWANSRFDAWGTVIEYLVWRGRVDEALRLASRLDTYRATYFARWLLDRVQSGKTEYPLETVLAFQNAAKMRASEGTELTEQRREEIEACIAVALSLVGAASDLDWWLKWSEKPPEWVTKYESLYPGGPDMARTVRPAEFRFRLTARAAWDMAGALKLVRDRYEHYDRRKWGQ